MSIRIRNLVVASVLSTLVGFSPIIYGQHLGVGGRPDERGGMAGREFVPPNGFTRPPVQEWPQPGSRSPIPGEPPARNPGREEWDRNVPLNDVVSMVQERFNATAVKTDTVLEGGQWVYRIRLLSADRSRVWTVNVDARTGRIN